MQRDGMRLQQVDQTRLTARRVFRHREPISPSISATSTSCILHPPLWAFYVLQPRQTKMPRAASPASVYTVSSSDSEDYAPSDSPPPAKKRRVSSKSAPVGKRMTKTAGNVIGSRAKGKPGEVADIEDVDVVCISRPHGEGYHATDKVEGVQGALLSWFEGVR